MTLGAAVRAAAAAALTLAFAGGGARAADTGYGFTILRGDSPIGTQQLRFTRDGDRLTVDIRTEVAVKIAFVTVYRYTQTIRQVWKGDRLQAFEAHTDDNGDQHGARARATSAGLEVEGSDGKYVAPGDTVPTGYWNRAIVSRDRGLDSRGRLVRLVFAPQGRKTVTADGRPVEAEVFKVSGDNSAEIAYGPDGSWVSMVQVERGNTITYIRDGGAGARK